MQNGRRELCSSKMATTWVVNECCWMLWWCVSLAIMVGKMKRGIVLRGEVSEL